MSEHRHLRRGWTTGSCATAAAKAAYQALLGHGFPDPVTITLPGGQTPAFALALQDEGGDWASAGVVKDAGDDPDVTHGVVVRARVRQGPAGSGITFAAGEGVGTVTRPGLPLPPGEPAINPVPRRMIETALREIAETFGASGDVVVEIAIPGGAEIAKKTLNGRLGIVGGLSVLGTTGIVIPYSCSSWIHSIHRGIDVARAAGLDHVAASTGDTSEKAIAALDELPEIALIDMGDFAGGTLKYLKTHPVERVTIAGGFAKMTKLGQGLMDLHSKRGAVDTAWLAERAKELGADAALLKKIKNANSGLHVLELCQDNGLAIAEAVAAHARDAAQRVVKGAPTVVDVAVFDRAGQLLARV